MVRASRRRLRNRTVRQAVVMGSRSLTRSLVVVTLLSAAAFAALTVVVATNHVLAFDSDAFAAASDLRAPWLTATARAITTLGLIAIVGPVLVLGAGLLNARRHRTRAAAIVAGGALAWIAVWITKTLVDRPRPSRPLVHTAGQSYPSAHAANSVGWLALAIALAVVIPARGGRIAVIAAGALIAALVGLSRVYLRAHFASDVLAGYALAVAMYALAAIAVIALRSRRELAPSRRVDHDEVSNEERSVTEPAGAQQTKETVVIAFDGSPAARRAIEEAARDFRSSQVLVVTVWEEGLAYVTPSASTEGMMMSPVVDPGVALEIDRGVHDHAERVSKEGAQLAKSLGLEAQSLAVPDEHDVAKTVLRVAEKHRAVAIVVGSRGLSGLRARLEGSTSKALVKHAPCPVVVVHEADEDPEATSR